MAAGCLRRDFILSKRVARSRDRESHAVCPEDIFEPIRVRLSLVDRVFCMQDGRSGRSCAWKGRCHIILMLSSARDLHLVRSSLSR